MKAVLRIPIWAIVLIALLLINLGWMSWNARQNTELRATIKQFKVAVLHTNNISGVGIMDAKTGKPLWIKWAFGDNYHQICYYFNGTNILNLHVWKGRPLCYDVGFYGPGKSSVWWWDLGRGTFIERNFFNTNGDLSKREVWYNQAWHTVNVRNGKGGIVINGQWHQLSLPTNSMWTIEAPTNAP
jgi:hypothetical protein